MPYDNPVLSGMHPDPSVCRVGSDYYLVTSSFEYFPGVPIHHSRDLVNWRLIGYCLTRTSQLPLQRCPCSRGIYAPTIRHHEGRFYMTTTNTTAGGNFIVHTDDIHGQWSEPLWVTQPGIDPSLFFDDDGKTYFQSTGMGQGICQSEIDPDTGKLLTEPRPIWTGTGGRYPESPHLYRINGLYYLMIAEGGTEYGHMETIARSGSPWGPFEPCPDNPILTHHRRDYQDSPIQGTGHADLVRAHDGSWWLIFLGFRPAGGRFHHLGRETFLAPVRWTDDGWPVVHRDGGVELQMDVPTLPLESWSAEPVRDDFDSPQPGLEWNFLREPVSENLSLTARRGWLRLLGSPLTLDDADSPVFIGRRQEQFSCHVATCLDFHPAGADQEAGMTVIQNNRFHYDLAVTGAASGSRRLILRRRVGDLRVIVAEHQLPPGPVTLDIVADKPAYHFSFGVAGSPLEHVGEAWTRLISTEVAGGFTGVFFGLYATGNGTASSVPADFDWFDYSDSFQPTAVSGR